MKIVNVKKFVRSIIIIAGIVFLICLFFVNKSFSHGNTQYKSVYVENGDTLWTIAKYEQENNEYYKQKDIRDIIQNIKSINNLTSSNLSNNQELNIPTL